VVLGGSGNGEQMAANKVKGIRAALCWTAELAQLAREHNDAQVVSIGGRFTATELAKEIVDTFVATEFSGVARHVRRLEMVTRFEDDGTLPPEPATA
jgi:ribose 5-phosphate isomerase B